VLALVFGRFVPGVLVPGVRVLGAAITGSIRRKLQAIGVARPGSLGSPRLSRLLELWLASCGWRVVAGCLKIFRKRIYTVGKDILLSERDGRGPSRAACAKRSEREQGREIV
jgi:hypothetical protein